MFDLDSTHGNTRVVTRTVTLCLYKKREYFKYREIGEKKRTEEKTEREVNKQGGEKEYENLKVHNFSVYKKEKLSTKVQL